MLIIFGAAIPVGAGEDNRTGVWGFARGKRETKKVNLSICSVRHKEKVDAPCLKLAFLQFAQVCFVVLVRA